MNDYVNHKNLYVFIILIQTIDIIMNFFTYSKKDYESEQFRVSQVSIAYFRGTFIWDAIAVLPYIHINRQIIFLRYLKIVRITNYCKYIDDFLIEIMESYFEKEKISNMITMFDLCTLLSFMCHFFACIWIRIGQTLLIIQQDGWIY